MRLLPLWKGRSRRWRWGVVVFILLLVYAAVGFWVIPPVCRVQAIKRLPSVLNRNVAIGAVRFNPFALSVAVHDAKLMEADGAPMAGWNELYINFDLWSSVWERAWVFEEMRLGGPAVWLVIAGDGTLNWASLARRHHPAPPPSRENSPARPLPRLVIRRLVVSDGVVSTQDERHTPPFRGRIHSLEFRLKNFSTLPGRQNPLTFATGTESGGTLTWEGDFSLDPIRSHGRIQLSHWRLKRYNPYLQQAAAASIESGRLGLGAEYHISLGDSGVWLLLTNVSVQLRELTLTDRRTDESIVQLGSFAVTNAWADLGSRRAVVGSLAAEDGHLLLRRETNGLFQVQTLLKSTPPAPARPPPPVAETAPPAAAGGTVPFVLRMENAAITNFSLLFEDRALGRPARLALDELALQMKGFSTEPAKPIHAGLSLRWKPGGRLHVQARAQRMPLSADAAITLEQFDLSPFDPYVRELARLVLSAGILSTTLQVQYGAADNQPPRLHLNGDVSLDKLTVGDAASDEPLVAWETLALRSIEADLGTPPRVQCGEIRLVEPKVNLTLLTDGRSNLPGRNAPPSAPPAPTSTTATPGPPGRAAIAVGTFLVENGSVAFTDKSIQPAVATSLESLHARLENFSAALDTRIKVDVAGKVDGRGPVHLLGEIKPDPADPFVDVRVAFTNMDLTPLSPYCGKYLGYVLQKGKLHLDLDYKIFDKNLRGDNKLLLDQPTLGARTDSPQATDLPVKLALALLKDRQGRILLDVPVSGRTDDPKFRVWGVIWSTVRNLIVRAAAAPFNLLGSLVGASEDLSFVAFDPGSGDLSSREKTKLDALARALYERPALNLEITASLDPVLDPAALKRNKLLADIQSRKQSARTDPDGSPTAPPYPQEYQRHVMKRFIEKHGEQARYRPRPSSDSPTGIAGASRAPWAARKGGPPDLPDRVPIPFAEIEARVLEDLAVGEAELLALLQHRAEQVRDYLRDSGKVEPERLTVREPRLPAAAAGQAKVELSLN